MLGAIAAGAWFRLHNLGEAALRADTIHFWFVCHMDISAWQVVTKWTELGVGQLPLPLAITKLLIDVFHLPVTHFTIRLPNALFGIALIPVMFAIGRRLINDRVGVVLAFLTALNSFHIQMSMEAYFYSSLVLGAGLMFLGALQAADSLRLNRPLPAAFFWVSGGGFFCIAYSQVTGWIIVFTAVVAVLWMLFFKQKRYPAARIELLKTIALYGVIGAPLVFVSWGLRHNLGKIWDHKLIEAGHELVATSGQSAWTLFCRVFTSMAWGDTCPRVLFGLLVFTLGVYVLAGLISKSRVYWFIPALAIGNYMLFLFSRNIVPAGYGSRYVAGILPIYLTALALGLAGLSVVNLPGKKIFERMRRPLEYILIAAGMILLVEPALASNRLSGKPIPYKDIIRFVNTRLAPGTVVLVDRWFEPWNELRVYPSTNVFFTFTVPNEPVKTYISVKWRDTARLFFEKYPEAAYLEISKSYWEAPEVGPWQWPRDYFAHHYAITNTAGIKLREMGLAMRDDFYSPYTNGVIVEIFYNTREDVIDQARKTGKEYLVLYGPGWGYVKLWQQLQDFRDWRVLEKTASLDVYNLTAATNRVTLKMRGMTLNGGKRVFAEGASVTNADGGGKQHDFRHLHLEEWELKNITLQPGFNRIVLSDSLWSVAKIPLLVDQIEMASSP